MDDIERLSKDIELQDFLGIVSNLKEEYSCKVILIFNQEYLKSLSERNETYKTFKEKVIDFEYSYNPPVEFNFESVREKSEYFTEQIKSFFERNNINNIRIMNVVINFLNLFGSYLEGIIRHNDEKSKTLTSIVEVLIPLIYYKRVENGDPKQLIEKIKEYITPYEEMEVE